MKNRIDSNSSRVRIDKSLSPIRTCELALTALAILCPSAALANFTADVQGYASTAAGSLANCLFPSGDYGVVGRENYESHGAQGSASGGASSSNPCSPGASAAVATSSAALDTGQLRAFASAPRGANDAAPPGTPPYMSEADARASFADDVNLLFNGLPVNSLANGLFGQLRLDIHGSRSIGAGAFATLDLFGPNDPGAGASNYDLQGGESLVVQFYGPFTFRANLAVHPYDGQIANFGSTGTLSITLPNGYTFGSSSGVLLTAVAAVPEPETYALILAGLGLMGFAVRRRGRGTRQSQA